MDNMKQQIYRIFQHHILLVSGIWCFLLYFTGIWLLAVTDPVEVNYAETAKEMLLSGDWFSPRIYGNYWYDKPAFFYWQLLAAFKIFGIHDFSARLFPGLTAVTGIFVAYKFGCYLHNVKTGLAGAFMLATSLEYWYLGHAVVTDMTLFVSTSVCLFFFYIYLWGFCVGCHRSSDKGTCRIRITGDYYPDFPFMGKKAVVFYSMAPVERAAFVYYLSAVMVCIYV